MKPNLMVYVTFKDKEEARRVASHVIEKRLAACANIFQPHESLYWWDGVLQDEQEVATIFKTSKERYKELEKAIKQKHSYDVPCIVALSIEGGNSEFLNWIETQTITDI